MIALRLNGEPKQLPPASSIQQALQHWGYTCSEIAVAVNGDFVPRSRYTEHQLHEQDDVEIVAPIQGG